MNSKREAAIEASWEHQGITNWRPPTPKELREVHDEAVRFGYDAGLRDSGGEWVAVSEKLPEKTGRYETTTSDGYVCNAGFISESQKWVGSFDLVDPETKIIAWREISEPYTQEKTNDKE